MSKKIDKALANLTTIVERQTKRVQTNKHRETVDELIADVAELEPLVNELIFLQNETKYAHEELLTPRSVEQHQEALKRFVEWMAEHAPESKIGDAVGFEVFAEGNGVVSSCIHHGCEPVAPSTPLTPFSHLLIPRLHLETSQLMRWSCRSLAR